MIYLIDDKKQRQEGYGWNTDRINRYDGILKPIYTYENMEDDSFRRLMFEGDNNIILFHESFFMGQNRDIVDLRGKIKTALEKNKNLIVVFFSGSIKDRAIKNREVLMPVSSLYQNLDVFLEKYGSDDSRIEYLLYGKNPEIENELKKSFTVANNSLKDKEPKENTKSHVILKSISNNTPIKPFCYTNEMLISDISNDKIFHELITGKLDEKKYQNIYIPLCFGSSFVDLNGLRLATALRCTENKNQLSNIYLYSHIGVNNLIYNEYFDILKTKNVFLIDYRYSAFQDIKSEESELTIDDLSKEIQKLKLDPPLNYADSHSIANEWAIHQWAKTIGCDETDVLTNVFQNVESNLYFKYLRTINPISEVDKISPQDLKIKFEGNPKVLLIDDEAEKGWREVFAYIFNDVYQNDEEMAIYQDTLEIDFKKITTEDLIQNSIQKIKDDDINLVILDFRLNPSDFIGSNPKDITSIRLLKKIKELNPGIQVIIFSATNKVWNLQALQDAGADGFILKDGGENIHKSINSFRNLTSDAFSRVFLKEFYKLLFQVRNRIASCDYEDGSDFESFLKTLQTQLKIIDQAGREVKSSTPISLDIVFLNCYNFLDLFKSQYIVEKDFRFYIGIEESSLHRYDHNHGVFSDLGDFIKVSYNDKPSWFQSMAGLLIDYFEVAGLNDKSIKDLWKVKNWRNTYIHEDKSHFSKSEVLKIVDLMVKLTSSLKE